MEVNFRFAELLIRSLQRREAGVMSHHRPPGRVEDFTKPFLVCFGVLTFTGLFTIWALFGYLASLASGWFTDRIISRIPRRN